MLIEFAYACELPHAGRLAPAPRHGSESKWRSSDPDRYLAVAADLDGDGAIDFARILVRCDGSGFAPFAALANVKGSKNAFQLEGTMAIEYLSIAGIRLARRGIYATACGKGYGCDDKEATTLRLPNDAVAIFKEDGAARLAYWDARNREFREAWLSD